MNSKILLAAIYLALGKATLDDEALAMAESELYRLTKVVQEDAGALAAEIAMQ